MTFREDMKAVSAELIDAFGETATFTGASGPYTVKVVFDAPELVIDPYTGDVDNSLPQALAKTVDVAGAKHKDEVRIGSVVYEITEARPDGHGITTLTLNKLRTD